MCIENGKWSIDGYVKGGCSICREERQYALYLSNVLRYYGNGRHRKELSENPEALVFFESIFKGESLDNLYIDNVFYEATFMRDIFERNRRLKFTTDTTKWKDAILQTKFKLPDDKKLDKEKSFNHSLLDYCWGVICDRCYDRKCDRDSIRAKSIDLEDIEEVNYGQNDIVPKNSFIIAAHSLARAMMNAKPDLAIIYHNKESERKLLFIECKFSSDEDYYYYKVSLPGRFVPE